jgi:hypothetical protein
MSGQLLYTSHRLRGDTTITVEARQFGSQVLNTIYLGSSAGKVLRATGVSEAALMEYIAAIDAEINSANK